MTTEDLITLGQIVCKSMSRRLGNEFIPANLQDELSTRGERNRAVLKLKLIRRDSVPALDVPGMLAEISKVSKRVKAFKQGCCGELAMWAYNSVRTATDAQIIVAPSTRSATDRHAFVLMGVANKFNEPTAIATIARDHPGAVIIDLWAEQNSAGQSVFAVGEYESKTSYALSRYDLDLCRTMAHT